ncbi:MAG: CpaD family pilus assembly protein [Planctomycetes bacterium]|nr:CpaD family pilus assembly protein [Planctomycetota bacterium]
MTIRIKRAASAALAASLGLTLSACGGGPLDNGSLYSVNQPVVERSNYTLDLMASTSGLTVPEQSRLADWFEAMDIGYGDRISVDDPLASAAVREDVAAIAGRFGLLIEEGAPVTTGYVDPGNVRVVVTRSMAHVPDCPNWEGQFDSTLGNNTSPGFGCSVNSNFAAMVADPEHLLAGAKGTGETIVMSSTKAIETYRDAQPSGAGGLPAVASQGN